MGVATTPTATMRQFAVSPGCLSLKRATHSLLAIVIAVFAFSSATPL